MNEGAGGRPSELDSGAWTVEVSPLPAGAYRASIVEFKDCAAEGPTRQAALQELETALELRLRTAHEHGEELPLPLDKELSRLSIRIPATVRRRLARLAEVEGVSLNALISSALSEYVGGSGGQLPGDFPPVDGDEAREVIGHLKDTAQLARSLEVAKAVIRSVEDRRGTNLGLVLRALLVDRIFAVDGEFEASRHLGKSARVALDAGHTALAEAFWRASLGLKDDNPISNGAYGQFLFIEGRHAEAIPYLEKSRSSLPWSDVELALCRLHEAKGRQPRQAAARSVIEELEKSALNRRALAHRREWLRYMRMLRSEDVVGKQEIEDLVQYSRDNAEWQEKIDIGEVLQSTPS